jgi:hypothetical protein
MAFATPLSTKLAALSEMVAVGEVLAGCKIHLYANQLIPSQGTLLTMFVEATFTGYVAQSVGAWGAAYIGPDGNAHVTAPGLQFQATDDVTPNTIYGWYMTNTAGTELVGAANFLTPIPIVAALQAVVMQPDFIYGP